MKTLSTRLSDVTSDVCSAFLLGCESPLLGAAVREDYGTLVNAPMPLVDQDSSTFRDEYWAAEAWSKYPFVLPGVNRETTAFEKFFEAEEQCRVANSRLVGWDSRCSLDIKKLSRARRLVAGILGRFDRDLCLQYCSFGPGATTSMPRRLASQQQKWGFASHVTEQALPWYLAFRMFHNGWHGPHINHDVVAGNRVTTVPKNAKTDRVIAIEPDWNMFFQRGIGGLIRSRLRRRLGLLTPDAQFVNKRAAQIGSATGRLATIDLSSASDSVSLALCEALLPTDWFEAMLQLRSNVGQVGNATVQYEKISSMGNGFTFELETLLFWALAKACCKDGTTLVYGDDIIVSVEDAPEVIFLLEQCGFRVNRKKTFVEGPFRESCGGHYHRGFDVTPPYFRHAIDNLPEYIRTANRVRRAASQRFTYVSDGRFEPIWSFLAKRIPKSFRGHEGLGDGCLHVGFDEARPVWDRRLQQWKVKCLVPVSEKSGADPWGGVFSSLWGRVSEGSYSAMNTGKWRVSGNTYTSRWTGPSPWLGEEFFSRT